MNKPNQIKARDFRHSIEALAREVMRLKAEGQTNIQINGTGSVTRSRVRRLVKQLEGAQP